jgi:hypothetical protein
VNPSTAGLLLKRTSCHPSLIHLSCHGCAQNMTTFRCDTDLEQIHLALAYVKFLATNVDFSGTVSCLLISSLMRDIMRFAALPQTVGLGYQVDQNLTHLHTLPSDNSCHHSAIGHQDARRLWVTKTPAKINFQASSLLSSKFVNCKSCFFFPSGNFSCRMMRCFPRCLPHVMTT